MQLFGVRSCRNMTWSRSVRSVLRRADPRVRLCSRHGHRRVRHPGRRPRPRGGVRPGLRRPRPRDPGSGTWPLCAPRWSGGAKPAGWPPTPPAAWPALRCRWMPPDGHRRPVPGPAGPGCPTAVPPSCSSYPPGPWPTRRPPEPNSAACMAGPCISSATHALHEAENGTNIPTLLAAPGTPPSAPWSGTPARAPTPSPCGCRKPMPPGYIRG
jgi:hypothetical protein